MLKLHRNSKKTILLILGMMLLIMVPSSVYAAYVPKQSHEFYVYDETGTLTPDTEKFIIDINKELYRKTGSQVVVAFIRSLQGYDIESTALDIFKEWGIGSRDKDNGVLLLIALDERSVRIETGYGIEGALPDGKAGRIIREDIAPYFQEEDYNQGALAGFNQIVAQITKEYGIEIEGIPEAKNYESEDATIGIFIRFIILIVIYLLIFGRRNRNGRGPGGGSGGSGRRPYYIPVGRSTRSWGSGSSGGFGGGSFGGGGRSGGGGASGGW